MISLLSVSSGKNVWALFNFCAVASAADWLMTHLWVHCPGTSSSHAGEPILLTMMLGHSPRTPTHSLQAPDGLDRGLEAVGRTLTPTSGVEPLPTRSRGLLGPLFRCAAPSIIVSFMCCDKRNWGTTTSKLHIYLYKWVQYRNRLLLIYHILFRIRYSLGEFSWESVNIKLILLLETVYSGMIGR